MKIVTCDEMKQWESETIRQGVSVASLMADAVEGCLHELLSRFQVPQHAVILCGKGNNGNDGIALGKRLEDYGWKSEIILSHHESERVQHPLDYVSEILARASVWPQKPSPRKFHARPRVVIDALLGIGAKGEPTGSIREMIEWAKTEKSNRDFYVSLDTPSGMDADTGIGSNSVFPADLTLVLGAMKSGCLPDTAGRWTGVVRGLPIGLQKDWTTRARGRFINLDDAGAMSRPVSSSSNKYHQGVVGIWAGSVGMTGAALLAAQASVRSGAGLVKLFSTPETIEAARVLIPEVMPRVIEEGVDPDEEFFKCDSLVIGPGLGRTETSQWFLEKVLKKIEKPVVLDADALFFIAQNPKILRSIKAPYILTPHTGEMKRLLGEDFKERTEAIAKWKQKHGGTLVLKGANTLVASEDGEITWNGSGNPGMASGGMGDVLAGLIGGLLAQEYPPEWAARLGVFWHGYAADKAAMIGSEASLIASEVIQALGLAWQEIRHGS